MFVLLSVIKKKKSIKGLSESWSPLARRAVPVKEPSNINFVPRALFRGFSPGDEVALK